MTEKNIFYESPRIETIDVENESVLCASNEQLENGGDIFGFYE